jgi:D-glycero-D-manno-heptose 1,7-bisphosphate phosphatase
MHKAVFLDRDGTLNRNTHYLIDFKDFEVLPGVLESLTILQDLGYQLFVVSNQSGVARGYFTLDAVMLLNIKIRDFFAENGITISDMVICPHHPEGKVADFSTHCFCRKPKPGMISWLAKRYHLDVKQSYMAGDRRIDAQAGMASGATGVLIGADSSESSIDMPPEFREFPTLLAFAESLRTESIGIAPPKAD